MSKPNREIVVAMKNSIEADAYAVALEGCFSGLSAVPVSNVNDLIATLQKDSAVCVLLDGRLDGVELFLHKRASIGKQSTVVLVGEQPSVPGSDISERVFVLPPGTLLKDLIPKMEEAFRISDLALMYCKITAQSLRMRSQTLPCDLFLKLSDEKYLKVMHAGEEFGQEAFERFFKKKVQYLYLPRTDFLNLADELLAEAAALTSDTEKLTVDAAATTTLKIFRSMHSLFEVDGFTSQVQNMTMASVKLAQATMSKNPALAELLANLNQNRDGFLSWHSTALSYLSCKLATAMDWKSETTFLKLSMASLLHDITLPSDDLVQSHDRIGTGSPLEESDAERIREHPTRAAELLAGINDVPGDVGFIVKQHHENAEGTGFPNACGLKDISPIVALFIISHDLVTAVYRVPADKFDMEKYLLECEKERRFTKGAFGQVFRGLMAKLKDL